MIENMQSGSIIYDLAATQGGNSELTKVDEIVDYNGVKILGEEDNKFWHDHKSAKINSIRTKNAIEQSDIVVVRFGDKYKQWNAAFDAGYAAAMSKSLIVMHSDDNQHALKEIDAMAQAVTSNVDEIVKILNYSCNAKI